MSIKQGDQRNHSFLQKKELYKIKNRFTINKQPEISSQFMDLVMK